MERAGRYNVGFNQYKTKAERRQHGKALIIVLDELLKDGWTPYEEYSVFTAQRNTSLVGLIDDYLEHCKSSVPDSLSDNTYQKYQQQLNLFKDWVLSSGYGNVDIGDVKKALVTSFMEHHRAKRGWSGKTYNDYLNNITTFFNYYHNNYDDLVDKVPTRSLSRKKVHHPGNKAWNDWQFKRLKEMMLDNGDRLLYTFCSFIYYAALRNEAEAIYLRAGDFNFRTKTLVIDSGTAKNRTTEYIPLYPDFLDLLYELGIDKMPPEYYIFGKPRDIRNLSATEFRIGAPYPLGQDYFAGKFRPYKVAMGIPPTEHGIYRYKHTRAQHLGEDGEDLYKIMKLLRHRDLATTMIYMRGLGVDTQNTDYKKGRNFND
nr:site-specific integrase [Hufsiella ginkgonis]